jgi:hypothetical protein
MSKQLRVKLLPNWTTEKNPDGPATFVRTDSQDSGALQASLMTEYTGGKAPLPTVEGLIDLAQGHGERHAVGELVETAGGACALGRFGTAVFRSEEFPRMQLWYLSNGHDIVLASYICCTEPEPAEVEEAQQIVGTLGLSGTSADEL